MVTIIDGCVHCGRFEEIHKIVALRKAAEKELTKNYLVPKEGYNIATADCPGFTPKTKNTKPSK